MGQMEKMEAVERKKKNGKLFGARGNYRKVGGFKTMEISDVTMGQNRKKHRINRYLINHQRGSEQSERASERSGAHERSKYCGASEGMSGASEQSNGRASGPVLTSGFLVDLAQNGCMELEGPNGYLVAKVSKTRKRKQKRKQQNGMRKKQRR